MYKVVLIAKLDAEYITTYFNLTKMMFRDTHIRDMMSARMGEPLSYYNEGTMLLESWIAAYYLPELVEIDNKRRIANGRL